MSGEHQRDVPHQEQFLAASTRVASCQQVFRLSGWHPSFRPPPALTLTFTLTLQGKDKEGKGKPEGELFTGDGLPSKPAGKSKVYAGGARSGKLKVSPAWVVQCSVSSGGRTNGGRAVLRGACMQYQGKRAVVHLFQTCVCLRPRPEGCWLSTACTAWLASRR